MIASMTKVLSILMIIMSTTEGYKAVQTKDAAHGEGALSLGGTDHKVAYAVDASGALTAMDSIEAEAGEAGKAGEAAEEAEEAEEEEAAEAKAADEMHHSSYPYMEDEFYGALGSDDDSSFQQINGTSAPLASAGDWSKDANWLPSFKKTKDSITISNPIPKLGSKGVDYSNGVDYGSSDKVKSAYAKEFQAAAMAGRCAADVQVGLSKVVFELWHRVVMGLVEVAKAIRAGTLTGVSAPFVLPTDTTTSGQYQIYAGLNSTSNPTGGDDKGLAFALLCRIVVEDGSMFFQGPFGATLGWLGPQKKHTPVDIDYPAKAKGNPTLHSQIKASYQRASNSGGPVAWLTRFRKLFDAGYKHGAVNGYRPNDREIITTLYKFPGSGAFKQMVYANYKNLGPKFNQAFLTAQYCANGLDGCTDGAKSDNRLLQPGFKDHFFFHPRSWSAFNLGSGRWFQLPTGDPPTEQRFGGKAIELTRTENQFTSAGALSTEEKQAWTEEGLVNGNTITMTNAGMDFTRSKRKGRLNSPQIAKDKEHTRKTMDPSGKLVSKPDAPAVEAIVAADWLRIGGASGTTSDMMALWHAFTPEVGEKLSPTSPPAFLTGREYSAQAMRSALLRFYLQSQVHSAIEVFLGAEPFLDGTQLSMVSEYTTAELAKVDYTGDDDTFREQLESALCQKKAKKGGGMFSGFKKGFLLDSKKPKAKKSGKR